MLHVRLVATDGRHLPRSPSASLQPSLGGELGIGDDALGEGGVLLQAETTVEARMDPSLCYQSGRRHASTIAFCAIVELTPRPRIRKLEAKVGFEQLET